MQNIQFTSPADEKILAGRKTMTARCWRRKPPKVGSLVTASTGRKASTRFAVLKITGIYEWDGKIDPCNAEKSTGLRFDEIAYREGFRTWNDFIYAYYSLNVQAFLDDKRTNYFISFELVEAL